MRAIYQTLLERTSMVDINKRVERELIKTPFLPLDRGMTQKQKGRLDPETTRETSSGHGFG
jgi:hypothetical protein